MTGRHQAAAHAFNPSRTIPAPRHTARTIPAPSKPMKMIFPTLPRPRQTRSKSAPSGWTHTPDTSPARRYSSSAQADRTSYCTSDRCIRRSAYNALQKSYTPTSKASQVLAKLTPWQRGHLGVVDSKRWTRLGVFKLQFPVWVPVAFVASVARSKMRTLCSCDSSASMFPNGLNASITGAPSIPRNRCRRCADA